MMIKLFQSALFKFLLLAGMMLGVCSFMGDYCLYKGKSYYYKARYLISADKGPVSLLGPTVQGKKMVSGYLHPLDCRKVFLGKDWDLEKGINGRKYTAWALGNRSTIFFHEERKNDFLLNIGFSSYNSKKYRTETVDIALNGYPLRSITLDPEWESWQIVLPSAQIQDGANQIDFQFHHVIQPNQDAPESVESRPLSAAIDLSTLEILPLFPEKSEVPYLEVSDKHPVLHITTLEKSQERGGMIKIFLNDGFVCGLPLVSGKHSYPLTLPDGLVKKDGKNIFTFQYPAKESDKLKANNQDSIALVGISGVGINITKPVMEAPPKYIIDTKYLPFRAFPYTLGKGWSDKDKWPTIEISWALGKEASIRIPTASSKGFMLEMELLPFVYPGAPIQSVDFSLNGHTIGSTKLSSDWKRIELPLPSHWLKQEDNEVKLLMGYSASPKDVIAGSTNTCQLSVAINLNSFFIYSPEDLAMEDTPHSFLNFNLNINKKLSKKGNICAKNYLPKKNKTQSPGASQEKVGIIMEKKVLPMDNHICPDADANAFRLMEYKILRKERPKKPWEDGRILIAPAPSMMEYKAALAKRRPYLRFAIGLLGNDHHQYHYFPEEDETEFIIELEDWKHDTHLLYSKGFPLEQNSDNMEWRVEELDLSAFAWQDVTIRFRTMEKNASNGKNNTAWMEPVIISK
ncbi:MAG: hypothetical protein HZA01_04340 [Nitrospinae bacterium]|nr:hypothetical protein [Nitrospinota bacterium]